MCLASDRMIVMLSMLVRQQLYLWHMVVMCQLFPIRWTQIYCLCSLYIVFRIKYLFLNSTRKRLHLFFFFSVLMPFSSVFFLLLEFSNSEERNWSDLISIFCLPWQYVDKDFGTGVLKISPGHDHNDYLLARKLGLPILNVMNKDGTLNDVAGLFW